MEWRWEMGIPGASCCRVPKSADLGRGSSVMVSSCSPGTRTLCMGTQVERDIQAPMAEEPDNGWGAFQGPAQVRVDWLVAQDIDADRARMSAVSM